MKTAKFLSSLAIGLLLAACGGGGNDTTLTQSTSGTGSGTAPTVATINVTASPSSIAADGSTTSTVTAVALDANNTVVPNVTVTFKPSAGQLQVVSAMTGTNGAATATLSAGTAAAGTAISVTASVGTVSGQTTVKVVSFQQSLSLTTDSPQIPSDGSKSAAISALLVDANNVALPGVIVQFATTSGGGVLTVTQATTDATGTAKATLNAGNDPTDRTITVTATAGSAAPATVPVRVAGTTLALTGPATLVQGSQGTYQVLLTNSSARGIPSTTVTVKSANGNTLAPANGVVTTDANGQASITLTATSVANGGNDTLTASALGLLATQALAVSSQNFSITTPAAGTKIGLSAVQNVTATWLSAGSPVVGQTVNFSATRGTLSAPSAVTDVNGTATVTISSTTAGPAVINASGTGVSAQSTIDFVATVPSQISVQASPAAVAVQAQSTITATVRDAQNNLVEGATVTFALNDSTGGQLSLASATTDAQGRAQTIYTAGSTTSAANGVVITASVQGTAVSGQTALTVGGQTVFLSLGTGNTINSPDQATYSITYAVLALDAQGAAVANVPIKLKALPLSYVKGARVWSSTTWATVASTLPSDPDASPPGSATCANEDTDYSGNINSLPNKDYNGNGKLDPGNVAAVSPSTGSTGANGELAVTITYPKDHAYYVTVQFVATTSVAGTQSSASSTFLLPGAAADFNTQTIGPPGPVSPYGTGTTCANPL
jgi:hypothetical protein